MVPKITTEDRSERIAPSGCVQLWKTATSGRRWPFHKLAAQTEAFDERTVAFDLGILQVIEQTSALANEQQQAATTVVIVLVLFKVFGEVRDAAR